MPQATPELRRCRDFNYRLLAQPNPYCACVEFDGRFEQRPVRWQATLVTLAQEQGRRASNRPVRPFIEIDPAGPDAHGSLAIRVGLAVAEIDAATVCKAIIMVRKYKRLRRGRMEFGAPEAAGHD